MEWTMSILEKLRSKLQPHVQRIEDGKNDEFDYLPAILHHVMDELQQHPQVLEQIQAATKRSLEDINVNFNIRTDNIAASITETHARIEGLSQQITSETERGEAVAAQITNGIDELKSANAEMLQVLNRGLGSIAQAIEKSMIRTEESSARIADQLNALNRDIRKVMWGGTVAGLAIFGTCLAIIYLLRQ